MTKVQTAPKHAPDAREPARAIVVEYNEAVGSWQQIVDQVQILHRRSAYTGLVRSIDILATSRGYFESVVLVVDEVCSSMKLHGLPVSQSWRHLAGRAEWQQLVANPTRTAEADRLLNAVAGDVADAVREINDQIEMSPQPAGEWAPAIDTLGEELLASLIGTSVSSIRRYAAGSRETPQEVAERLHFIALVLADLAGSYNDFGMRRWFTRPRSPLNGRSPADLLGKFDIDGGDAQAVAALASALTGAGAA